MLTIPKLKGYAFTYKTPKYSGGVTIVGVEAADYATYSITKAKEEMENYFY